MTETKISDLALASFLLAHGVELQGLDDGPPGRRQFIFLKVPPGLIERFYNDALVPARTFAGSLRHLRGLLAQPHGRTGER
jgi:hypothetical protein